MYHKVKSNIKDSTLMCFLLYDIFIHCFCNSERISDIDPMNMKINVLWVLIKILMQKQK